MTNKTNKNKVDDIPVEALQLIPWYATGCLSADEYDYFQQQLKKYPGLQKHLEEEQKIIGLISQDKTILELSSLESTEARLKKVLNQLEETIPVETSSLANTTAPRQNTPGNTLTNWIKNFVAGETNTRLRYASFASIAIITLLLVTFIAPTLKDKSQTSFHPATVQTKENTQRSSETIFLLGLNGNTRNSWLMNFLKQNHAKLSKIPGKDGLYRVRFSKKLSKKQTAALINQLNKQTQLIWFAGEAY